MAQRIILQNQLQRPERRRIHDADGIGERDEQTVSSRGRFLPHQVVIAGHDGRRHASAQ
jgi:hypothetical protein